jgi:hypothetical protein
MFIVQATGLTGPFWQGVSDDEENQFLKLLTQAGLFEALANDNNGVVEVHVSNQAQSNMG